MSSNRHDVELGELSTDPVRRVFEEDWGRLVGLARAVLADRHGAEEVVAEAFANTLERWPQVRNKDDPYGYVRTATLRLAQRRLWRWRNRVLLVAAVPDCAETAVAAPAGVDVTDEVLTMLRSLTSQQRACLALHYLEDMSVEDCASTLQLATGTVKSHLSRARKALRDVVERGDHDDEFKPTR